MFKSVKSRSLRAHLFGKENMYRGSANSVPLFSSISTRSTWCGVTSPVSNFYLLVQFSQYPKSKPDANQIKWSNLSIHIFGPFGWTMNIWKWGRLCPDSGQLLFSKPHHDNTYFHFKMGLCDVSCKLIVRENKNELMRYSFIWTACGVRVEESFHGLFMMRVFFSLCEHTHTQTKSFLTWVIGFLFLFFCIASLLSLYTRARNEWNKQRYNVCNLNDGFIFVWG